MRIWCTWVTVATKDIQLTIQNRLKFNNAFSSLNNLHKEHRDLVLSLLYKLIRPQVRQLRLKVLMICFLQKGQRLIRL